MPYQTYTVSIPKLMDKDEVLLHPELVVLTYQNAKQPMIEYLEMLNHKTQNK